jgi:hypothetical protein
MMSQNNQRSLKEIFQGKDTDKDTLHSYVDVYAKLLDKRRDTVLNFLEIGVLGGGSIQAFHEYFDKANIVGLDTTVRVQATDKRIRLLQCDAYSKPTLDIISDDGHLTYDVMIDDGPHSLDSMIYFASNYSKLLASDGIMIIEDIQEMDWIPKIKEAFPEEHRDKILVYDLRHIKGRWDDILVVLDLAKKESNIKKKRPYIL